MKDSTLRVKEREVVISKTSTLILFEEREAWKSSGQSFGKWVVDIASSRLKITDQGDAALYANEDVRAGQVTLLLEG